MRVLHFSEEELAGRRDAACLAMAAPDMVFFLHMILMHSKTGPAMCLGHTVRVTDTGVERLHRAGLDLVVNA